MKSLLFWLCALLSCQSVALIYQQNGQWVESTEKTALSVEAQVQDVLIPSAASGFDALLPRGSEVISVDITDKDFVVSLRLDEGFLRHKLTEPQLERISRSIDLNLSHWSSNAQNIHISAEYQGKQVALSNFLNIQPVPQKPDDLNPEKTTSTTRATQKRSPYSGALNNKVLFISQAHGWIDYDDFREWSTQRGITHDIVEDFVNSEGMNQYLLEYLDLAGATTFTLRERDMNSDMLIVDEADLAYSEVGDDDLFNASGANGFANGQAPYSATNDPFRDNGGTDRIITTSSTETAYAQWTLNVPSDGYYHVYVSYSGNGNRPTDAEYTVRHGGIDTQFTVNQQKHRYLWNHLGEFYFTQGGDNHVRLSNQSDQAGTTVSADAVRLGGGMGDVRGNYHSIISGHPRWEEGARTWVQYQGANSSVYGSGDVSSRSRFADWEYYTGEDALYVSWHSNAFNGTARGTNTYIYSSNPPNGTYDTTQAIAGSAGLQTAIHNEIINDIRGSWDANWQDRGLRSAYFGEINPNHNNEMPSVLIELAFHDNEDDANALRHPQFRKIAARAVYQGIVKYFAARDGVTAHLLPEPPEQLQVLSQDSQTLTISWQAAPTDVSGVLGDAASSYVIYRSSDGRNFDNGIEVNGLSHSFNGLQAGQTLYFKVKGKNQGGLSLDSEVLGARLPHGQNKVLVVNGFDRLNSGQLIYENMPDIGGFVDRMYLRQMNRFDYVVEHGDALSDSQVAFDSASNESIEAGSIDLGDYVAVLWALGEESSLGVTLSSTEQSLIATYLNQGGQLFISGAEIAWDLDNLGSASDQEFYNNTLMTAYWSDDAGTYEATGLSGSPYAGINNIQFDDGSYHSYQVEYPDELQALSQADHCLQYSGAQFACTYVDTGVYKVIHLGFPFETITSQQKRNDLMAATMNYFLIDVDDDLIFEDGFEN
ncbi:N-acetylmuramoyl-L-alanine amidase [Marinicella rhabdoformis]|uniref:golvesin C-terminal-like domain-containing protein n=1 Tax=Marinicella rhabdoformis TaxID=2580566 RepID=UPI0012AEC81F|nr:N-acetylmuramoyl-L-alanine amidase [Marinicella rhabdoformis]